MLKKLFLLFVFLVLLPVAACADVSLSSFPDPELRRILSGCDSGWEERDSNGKLHTIGKDDGVLSDQELRRITGLSLGSYVKSIQGTNSLTYLTWLSWECDGLVSTMLDVSNNKKLKELRCSNVELTSLNVSGCTALTRLDYSISQITTLNVSGCTALEYLGNDYGSNQITTLDASGCTALTALDCSYNQLTELNVSGCTALEYLKCGGNQLTTLDVSGYTALKELYCKGNQLTTLDVSSCTALTKLDCYGNQLESINVSGCTALKELNCNNNQLTELNVSGCTALTRLYCGDNQLTTFDASGCTALESLGYSGNQLTELNVSGCTALRILDCSNQLISLDVTGCTALEYMYLNDNQLTELNVSDCTALKQLHCNSNQLTTLDVSSCTVLEALHCYGNQLTELNVSGCTALTYIRCYNNQLTELDLSECTYLRTGDFSPQKRRDLKVKKTSKGYEVNMDDYVSHPENIKADSILPTPKSYNAETGVIVFSDPITSLSYKYIAHPLYNYLMEVELVSPLSVAVIERGDFSTYTNYLIGDMTDTSYLDIAGEPLTESRISSFSYSDYGKFGFTADGNSRLIIRVQTDKPGTISFSGYDEIGATLESFTSRAKILPSESHSVSEKVVVWREGSDYLYFYQVSAVLVAPEKFPEGKDFPSDKFKIHVKFTDEDGETKEEDVELTIAATPVLLIPGMFDNADETFGISRNTGVWYSLMYDKFDETHVDFWDYDGSKGPNELLANNYNELFHKLNGMFGQYASAGIVCTKADIVAHGMGGLMARKFLTSGSKDSDDGNNWTVRSYRQGMVRKLITVATPHRGTPWADTPDRSGIITTLYNAILSSPFYGDHPGWEYVLKPFTFMIHTMFPSPQIFQDAYLTKGSAWSELKTTEPRSYGFPAKVPMFAIAGDSLKSTLIQDSWTLLTRLVNNITGAETNIYDMPSFLINNASLIMDVLSKLQLVVKKAGVRAGLGRIAKGINIMGYIYDMPTVARLFTNAFAVKLFNGYGHDMVVSTQSATQGINNRIFSNSVDEALSDSDKYSHWSICQQIDVGVTVASLLKDRHPSLYQFTVFDTETPESTGASMLAADYRASENVSDDFDFTETLRLNVKPSNILTSTSSQTLKFTVVAPKKLTGDVYCTIGSDEFCRFFKLIDADGTGRKFQAELNAKDLLVNIGAGVLEVQCFSLIPDNSGMYTSNAAYVGWLTNAVSEDEDILPSITTSKLTTAVRKKSYSLQLKASGTTPIIWTHTGDLPAGLKLSASGKLSGTPTKAGSYTFTVKAENAAGASSETFTLKVTQTKISGTVPETATRKSSFTAALKASSGTSPYTWSISGGKLPNGLNINTETGAITGLPTKAGTYTFTVKAKDKNGVAATKSYTVKITQPVISGTLADSTLKAAYSKTLKVSGGAEAYTWAVSSGELPTGLKLTYSGTKATISGTPTTAGTYTFKIKVTDANKATATQSFTVKITKPAISGTLADGIVKAKYSKTLTVSCGVAPYKWTVSSGTLPNGLKLTYSDSKATISGKPTKAGTFTFKIKATDANKATAAKSFTVNITQPEIAGTFANSKLKAKYSKAVTVSGGTEAYTWSMTGGTLPTGLKLTYSGAKAKLSGTPTSSGTFTFTLKVTDANKATATQSFTVKITKPTISGTLPDGTVKTKYSATLKVSGGTASYTWVKASGTLPNGLKLTSSNTKATISGTPTKAGTFTFKIKVTDANGATKSKSFTVNIAEASASGKESTNEKSSSSEKTTEKSQSEKNQDETQSSLPENSPETLEGEDTDVNLYAELNVVSEDIVEAYDGKDSDLVKVKADTPLRFTVGDWGTEVDDVAVYVDDKALGSVHVSDEGRFTLPAEVVTGDFKVGVKATSTAGKNLESEELYIITE